MITHAVRLEALRTQAAHTHSAHTADTRLAKSINRWLIFSISGVFVCILFDVKHIRRAYTDKARQKTDDPRKTCTFRLHFPVSSVYHAVCTHVGFSLHALAINPSMSPECAVFRGDCFARVLYAWCWFVCISCTVVNR